MALGDGVSSIGETCSRTVEALYFKIVEMIPDDADGLVLSPSIICLWLNCFVWL